MSDPQPNPELLRSLGHLARGLSALFWGLPASLIICTGTASAGWFKGFWAVPALAATGLLLFGLWQMGSFQKQERPWRAALDRARVLALVNFGLCPFLYWWNRMPGHPFFTILVGVLALSGLLFLFDLNLVLARLGAMLPDETLRHETKQFTTLNRALLVAMLFLVAIYFVLVRAPGLPPQVLVMIEWLERTSHWSLVFLILVPLSLTMALIWKTKEVILASVFDVRQ
ncbi:MAG: hypothetical protein DME26_03660 [Verrucomicrobia bacterium]|nr:MAG: hypothetical protein DME26_03660 [Verrucomicrobiota bacterium]